MKRIIILLLVNCAFLTAQNVPTNKNMLINKKPAISSADTMKLAYERLRNELNISKNMLEVMEKTNQQLNLWSNPLSIFIEALGVLFTLLAIVFTFVIFRQGKEYKDQISNLIQSYQTALKKLVEDWEKRIKIIDEQIENNDAKLLSATDEQKKVIQNEIDKLKRERETINFPLAASGSTGSYPVGISGYSGYGNRFAVCRNCNNTFSLPTLPQVVGGRPVVHCPNCNSTNIMEI